MCVRSVCELDVCVCVRTVCLEVVFSSCWLISHIDLHPRTSLPGGVRQSGSFRVNWRLVRREPSYLMMVQSIVSALEHTNKKWKSMLISSA